MRNLSLVVCGAPLAARAHDVASALRQAGWSVTLVLTSAATAWLEDEPASQLRAPTDPKPPRPDAVVVCPLTFNTANKWVHGIADSRPLSLLSESLGAGVPIVAVPFFNESLFNHPAWPETQKSLTAAGVLMLGPTSDEFDPVASGTGDAAAHAFDPARIVDALLSRA